MCKRFFKISDFPNEAFSLEQVSDLRTFGSPYAYIPRRDIWNILDKKYLVLKKFIDQIHKVLKESWDMILVLTSPS